MTEKTFEELEKEEDMDEEETTEKKDRKLNNEIEWSINWKSASYLMWIGINAIWWLISVKSDIDVNPFLNNTGEVILNIVIFVVGLIIIHFYFKKKKKEIEDGKR